MNHCLKRSVLPVLWMLASLSWADEAPVLPEAHDPVLGKHAAIVEWAWSPKYAKRFNLPVQPDGLRDGHLWLVGVKILRAQHGDMQSYRCRIVGLIDNKAPMLWPPGDRYLQHPGYRWLGGLPGSAQAGTDDLVRAVRGDSQQRTFSPGHAAWARIPKDEQSKAYPGRSMTSPYILFHRYHTADLAYFELEGACRSFNDPVDYRNELRFPTRIDGVDDEIAGREAVWEPSALRFYIPDPVMVKTYPVLLKAADWNECLMHRSGMKNLGTIFKQVRERLGSVSCDPVKSK